jgi:aldehyde:ferredoxin oxidoreductase
MDHKPAVEYRREYDLHLIACAPFGESEVDRLSYDEQPQLVAEQEGFYTFVDSMVLCKFLYLPSIGPIRWDETVTLCNLVTGLAVKRKDLITKAKRINNARAGSFCQH